jgi:hypothetical protein
MQSFGTTTRQRRYALGFPGHVQSKQGKGLIAIVYWG